MSEKEMLKRLERLEKIANYTAIPKLIEERKKLLEKERNETARKRIEAQIKKLKKFQVAPVTLLDLYGAHYSSD